MKMLNNKIYFYMPGAESLNLLYFLAERYNNDLIVITPSVSVKEVCEIIGLNYMNPKFYNSSEKKEIGLKYLKNAKFFSFLNILYCKIYELFHMIIKMIQAKKMTASLEPGSILYYSTFFYDVPGILFLGSAVRSKKISVKLVWPSETMRFNAIGHISLFTTTFYLNILTSRLFSFHLDPMFGRVIGVNPRYIRTRKLQFFYENEKFENALPDKYIKKALSFLNVKFAKNPRVLFLGDYSVEDGITAYGDTFLKVLSLLSEIDTIDTYYKPHPLYHSINHSALKKISVLDTQIPVEFLDDGSWLYIISFATTAFMKFKSSKCICLLKLDDLKTKSFDLAEFLKLLDKSVNQIIYPQNLNAFKVLLTS